MRNNLAESVRARLHNIAKAQQTDLQQMMERFALERVSYRIGQSRYNKQFMLKGAMLFSLWYEQPSLNYLAVVILTKFKQA
ncbi:MAG: hypothetical protein A3I77_07600 [Gammaproteobacteria bacterium RIFCSPLOWO2_02_FULL_42_14]|nr:MAG: hypothetical protein A3B71_03430 [Gammaproteobacteria bacterium RIFCSPHIGHO2_02_FULL_42_43]OGT28611.1 MAG: hypothetical protein A2624_03570 [Gammaproteobacteria bacterium RIFCSPHIGHO2_01_FULL_42_8]OGT53017.1 MAG: hypothetical protein A3E54_08095 [Gammaproteobacteria bacterium RIFCSPHIGHO2_12_FULL_41_25]OGT61211.1 MAG: hypothetical protein A3I77_07600 [Gammaproteobacteria bacterium RIFCSPLOWO2_02_FULL_42_14]OGT87138.1 MAG: hypothetical protein A3G86_01320 [Gammaproteobacteria bacterium R